MLACGAWQVTQCSTEIHHGPFGDGIAFLRVRERNVPCHLLGSVRLHRVANANMGKMRACSDSLDIVFYINGARHQPDHASDLTLSLNEYLRQRTSLKVCDPLTSSHSGLHGQVQLSDH